MSMGTISDIIGLVFLAAAFIMAWRNLRPSRRNPNQVDGKVYED